MFNTHHFRTKKSRDKEGQTTVRYKVVVQVWWILCIPVFAKETVLGHQF